jgi:hypothetical protein
VNDVERTSDEIARLKRRLAALEAQLAFYRAFEGIPAVHVNTIRRAVIEQGLDNWSLEAMRAFINERTDSELSSVRNLGAKGVKAMRAWAAKP